MSDGQRWVYVVVSAAPPVLHIDEFIGTLQERDWQVCLIATPAAASWIDVDAIAEATGCLTRVTTRAPGQQDSLPTADVVVAAPLTFNSINKWAAGFSDSVALGVLNELLSTDVPIIAVPCVKMVLRKHPAYDESLARLVAAGVTLVDPDVVTVRGDDGLAAFRWSEIVAALDSLED